MAAHNLNDLPFRDLTNYSLADMFETDSSRLQAILTDNGITNLLQRSSSSTDMHPIAEGSCEYYNHENFRNLTLNNEINFSIFHQNIRSLSKHVGKFSL